VDIQDLMRSCCNGPTQSGTSQFNASLLEQAHDASIWGTGQRPFDIH
jgi:hypothetical protein